MKLLEVDAKALLADHGAPTPTSVLAATPDAARDAARSMGGRVAVKAQVPAGGRGKAGGVVLVEDAAAARDAAAELLGSRLGDHVVTSVLVEAAVHPAAELYVAAMVDTSAGVPVVLVSPQGGVDVEDAAAMVRIALEPGAPLTAAAMGAMLDGLGADTPSLRHALAAIHETFVTLGALLVEVNPLAVTGAGEALVLDAKIELDDAAPWPTRKLVSDAAVGQTELEREATARGLKLIELGGDVAILANGAGLTMTTMDAVAHHGGSPANFLEIGGDAYTLARPALELTLRQPGVKSLLVNFCGAFARCDVMTEGVVDATEALEPDIEIVFSIHGTGQDEARSMVRDRLGIEPHERMDDAVRAAVQAASR